jgi:hypothetical protein
MDVLMWVFFLTVDIELNVGGRINVRVYMHVELLESDSLFCMRVG